jgi:hypothetical protein
MADEVLADMRGITGSAKVWRLVCRPAESCFPLPQAVI